MTMREPNQTLHECPICGGYWLALLKAEGRMCSGCGGSGKVDSPTYKRLIDDMCEKMIDIARQP